VIIFESHTNDIEDVEERDWANLGELLNWTVCKFDIQGGGFAMRFGHSDFNASTIRHLHAHIQVPSKDTIQQLDLLRRFHEQCNCPICKLKDNKTKLLLVNDRWRAANVCTPLPFHKKHIVIANKETFDDITKLDDNNWIHLGTILQATTKNMKEGGIVIRFGDSRFHGGSPGHVYCEIMEPDLSGPSRAIFLANSKTGEPICKATFCKDRSPAEEARRKRRIKEII